MKDFAITHPLTLALSPPGRGDGFAANAPSPLVGEGGEAQLSRVRGGGLDQFVGGPPHPGPLPAGEREYFCGTYSFSLLGRRDDIAVRAPSPRRGEGWGEGAAHHAMSFNVFHAIDAEQYFPADGINNAVDVLDDLIVPEAYHAKAVMLDHLGARLVSSDALISAMLPAIKFDDEFEAAGTEVSDIVGDWFLPDKFCVLDLPAPQPRPEFALDYRLILAQASGSARQSPLRHRQSPLTLTLSPPGRGNHSKLQSPHHAQAH